MIQRIECSPDTQLLWDQNQKVQHYRTPFSTYAWQHLYFSTVGKNMESYILSLPDRHIIAPFERNAHLAQFSGGVEISDYMDLVGPDEEMNAAWDEILHYIKSNGITTLRLPNVREQSQTYSYFKKKSQEMRDISLVQEDTTPILTLPTSFDAYLSSLNPKHAHEAERKIRKFEREHPDATLSVSHDDTALDTAIRLMKLDPRKEVFFTDAYDRFFHRLAQTFGDSLLIHIISVGHTPVSAILGFSVGTQYFLYNSGYDQVNGNGAGFYLKVKSIEWAIKNGYTIYNFLQGNERYKYELGGVDAGIYTIICSE